MNAEFSHEAPVTGSWVLRFSGSWFSGLRAEARRSALPRRRAKAGYAGVMLLARVGTAGVVYALAVVGMAADQAPEPRFTPLFDGKTLEGWVVENDDPSSFVVRDGVLRVEGRAGWLRSAREFRDFALRTEFR